MIDIYAAKDSSIRKQEVSQGLIFPHETIWIDLLNPTKEEEKAVENFIGLEVPTHEEMQEIELSSRLYIENDAYYMTATLVTRADTPQPQTEAVTFILTGGKLVTIRYIDMQPFRMFSGRMEKSTGQNIDSGSIFTGLIEAITDRIADILEKTVGNINAISTSIFSSTDNSQNGGTKVELRELLQQIALNGDLVSKTRESLVSLNRMTRFFSQSIDNASKSGRDLRNRINTLSRDILALSDHASFVSSKVTFLLDATLGMINIEQNNIIKIFSVASVALLPPTLVASIYGMNFHFMPELDWKLGYPLAILIMFLSAFLPFKYFKKKRWL